MNRSYRSLIMWPAVIIGILILLFILRRQQVSLSRLEVENRALQSRLEAASTAPAETPPPAAPSEQIPPPPPPTPAATPHPEPPAKNQLSLAGTEVVQTTTGLVAIMHFKPAKSGPLGLVALSVRLPASSEIRIQSLRPNGSATYEDSDASVAGDGHFAFFQGTLGDERAVDIALGISGAARAFVKGSCGINAFQLDVQPDKATIR